MPSAIIFFKLSFPLPLWMQLLPSNMVACLIGHLYSVLPLRWAPCPWVIDTRSPLSNPWIFFKYSCFTMLCLCSTAKWISYTGMLAQSLQSCPTLCNPMDCSPPGSSVHGNSLGKNTGVGCYAFLQGIFPTWGLNQCLLHCRQILHPLSHHEAHRYSYVGVL